MAKSHWLPAILLAIIGLLLGLLLVVAWRPPQGLGQAPAGSDWEDVVADLVDSNARLRDEIKALEFELADLDEVEQSGALLQVLVDEVNYLRMANGLVQVSGPGVEVVIDGAISVLDLHDLINELRNAGAEALALNDRRLAAWSAISTDGEHVTVDGRPVIAPYRLQAIGDAHTLEVALNRPGGLISLLRQAHAGLSLTVERRETLTLPVYDQPYEFAYAEAVE